MVLAPLSLLFLTLPLPQVEKLNDALAVSLAGDVTGVRLGPVTERALFLVDRVSVGFKGLFVVKVDGSATPLRLDRALGGWSVPQASFSPAGSRVVYLEENVVEPGRPTYLFSVPTNRSSAPVQLNGPLSSDRDVIAFAVTLDSSWVLYSSNENVLDRHELLRVPIGGGTAPLALSGSLPADAQVYGIVASPDGVHAVYQVSSSAQVELFSVRVDGSAAPVPLNGPLVADGRITSFRVSPAGDRVVYSGDQDVDGQIELYSVPIDGSLPAVRLNGTLVAGGVVYSYGLSPDGARVFYLADQLIDGVTELFTVPVDGSSPAVHVTPGGVVTSIASASFDPTSTWLLFRTDLHQQELYSAPAAGGAAPTKLSSSLALEEDVVDWVVSTDGTAVVYRTLESFVPPAENTTRLWRVPTDASQPPGLQFERTAPNSFYSPSPLLVSPDFGRVLCSVGSDREGRADGFWSVPTDGSGAALRLDDPLESPGGVAPVSLASFGARVLFLGNHAPDGGDAVHDLYSAPVDGSAASQRLSELVLTEQTGDVLVELLSPDGRTAVYLADQESDGIVELFSVPLDRSRAPLRMNLPLAPGEDVAEVGLTITPDSSHVLFLVGEALYSARLDGSAPAVFLDSLAPGGTPVASPSGHAVYSASASGIVELFSVPYAGGADPVRLNPPLASDRDVASARVAPDGSLVVYQADQDVNDRFELYRVPIVGGPAVRLDDASTWAPGERIYGFEITRNGQDVVYRFGSPRFIFDGTFNVTDLYSVPTDASHARVRLTSFLMATLVGRPLPWYEVSAGSSRVAFLFDDDLYSVPVQGGAPPQTLAAPPASQRVSLAQLTPDGARVVYLADQTTPGVSELHSIPIDGSAPAVRLNDALVGGGEVQSWIFAPDSRRIVFVADALVDNRPDLFVAPVDGSATALLLRSPVPPTHQISADGQRLLFTFGNPQSSAIFSLPLNGCSPARRLTTVPHHSSVFFAGILSSASAHRVLFRSDLEQNDVAELFTAVDEAGALSVTPATGPAAGGNTVTVHGVGFTATTAVWFDGRPATNVVLVDGETLTATVPALSRSLLTGPGRARVVPPRKVDVRVGDCGTTTTLPSAYTYR